MAGFGQVEAAVGLKGRQVAVKERPRILIGRCDVKEGWVKN